MKRDEARDLPEQERKPGLVVEGNAAPFGGSWIYNKEANTLTLQEPPTAAEAPKQEEKEDAN
jgi:hypothetical protein